MSCWFPPEKKRGVFVPGRAGSTAGLFSIVCPNWTAQHSANPPLSPATTPCPHPQHLIRQLTPPSVVSAGGAVCSLPDVRMRISFILTDECVVFFLSLSFVVLRSLKPDSDHLANGLYFLSLLYWLNLCRQFLQLNKCFSIFHLLPTNQFYCRVCDKTLGIIWWRKSTSR